MRLGMHILTAGMNLSTNEVIFFFGRVVMNSGEGYTFPDGYFRNKCRP